MSRIVFCLVFIIYGCQQKNEIVLEQELQRLESSILNQSLISFQKAEEFDLRYTNISIRKEFKNYIHGICCGDNINSELAAYYRSKGILQPEEMALLTFTSLHRKLNNGKINLDSQIEYIKEKNEKELNFNLLQCELMSEYCEKYKVSDTISIRYTVGSDFYVYANALAGLQKQGKSNRDVTYRVEVLDLSCDNSEFILEARIINSSGNKTKNSYFLPEISDTIKINLEQIIIELFKYNPVAS